MNKITKTKSNSLTKSKEFRPNGNQLLWISTAIQLMTDSVTEISKECKITRTTWYEWMKDDQFRLWFKQEWDRRLAGEAWKLDVIGMKNAKRDHKYWQDMQRRVGNLNNSLENNEGITRKLTIEEFIKE